MTVYYGDVCPGGCLPRGVSTRGVSAQEGEGVYIGGGVHPLWTVFLTHACENITFPQLLLRTVKIEGLLNAEIVDCNPSVKVRSYGDDNGNGIVGILFTW